MDLYEVIEHWQNDYCAGSPMPKHFREFASKYFDKIYNMHNDVSDIFECKEQFIYRAIMPPYEGPLIRFDDLYYSFSSDLLGLKQFAIKDKNVRGDLCIIIAKPFDGLYLNEIGNSLFDDYEGWCRFYEEKEVVSKLSFKTVNSIFYLKDAKDIENYETIGTKISNKDYRLKFSTIVKKYNLPVEYLK